MPTNHEAPSAIPTATESMRWPDQATGPWFVRVHFADIDGRRECVGLDIRSFERPNGEDEDDWPGVWPVSGQSRLRPVTAGAVRTEIPVDTIIRTVKARAAMSIEAYGSGIADPERRERVLDQARRYREQGRTIYDDAHWHEVTRVYADAWAAGDHPTKAVADTFGVDRSIAGKWVARAREKGLLEPTQQRRAGGVPTMPADKPAPKSRRKS